MPSSLEQYFSRILWINLNRRTDRRAQADAELALLRIKQHMRVPGIDRPDNGNAGCTSTHRMLWRRIAAGEFGDRVLVLEDDFMLVGWAELQAAGFTPDSEVGRIFFRAPWVPIFEALPHIALNERFDAMAAHLPDDWDVLYLGGGYQCNPISRVSQFVVRNAGMLGTVAYAIRPHMAAAITKALDLSHPADAHPRPVDMVLCGFARDHRFYTLSPRLFIPRPGNKSDLQPGYTDGFPFSYCDPVHERMV